MEQFKNKRKTSPAHTKDMTVGSPYMLMLEFAIPIFFKPGIPAAIQYGRCPDRREIFGNQCVSGSDIFRNAYFFDDQFLYGNRYGRRCGDLQIFRSGR